MRSEQSGETAELYWKHGTHPLSGCIPMVGQPLRLDNGFSEPLTFNGVPDILRGYSLACSLGNSVQFLRLVPREGNKPTNVQKVPCIRVRA